MKNLVIVWMCVIFLYTSCKTPMPARELFGSEVWDTFSKAARADAYALKPDAAGMIAGPTTFASSARRDAQALHRIWSFMQDHETFGTERPTNAPVPQYLIRYGRERKSVDLVFDIELIKVD